MDLPNADRYYLELNGANSSAWVYLNGKEIASHDGGYSTWRVDITDLLQRENLFAIAVDNAPNDRVYPQVADFTFYGGLYRDVNIICVSESHFDLDYFGGSGLQITPDVSGKVQIRPFMWATHVWNMFDFGADARAEGGENGQNHKGLMTFDRKYKKDSFYAYKAWLNPEPMIPPKK